MTNSFLQALAGIKGRLISLAGGIVAAIVVRALAKFGFEPDPQTLNDITELSFFMVTLGIEWAVNHLNSEGVKEIQKVLPPEVKVDGVPGEKTLAAVQEAVDNQK